MLISDETLLSGQPLSSGKLPFPRGWPLNRGSTVPHYIDSDDITNAPHCNPIVSFYIKRLDPAVNNSRSYLVNVNGSLYQRNQKFLRVAKERLSKPVQENLPGAQSYKHQPERPSPTSLPPIDTPVIPLEDHPQ